MSVLETRLTRGFAAIAAVVTLALAGPALAQTPALISATSPGTAISTTQTSVVVPVTISRDATTALLGYSIKIHLSPEFTALNTGTDLAIGSFMTFIPPSGTRNTDFHVLAGPGAGDYTVDGVALGTDCGPTGTAGTLFTVTVRSSSASATGTLTITSVSLRDCANTPVASTIGTASSVTIDNSPPSVAVTSPNGGETWVYQTTHDITWTASDIGGGVASVDLDYSTNGGGSWTPIATGEANDGTYAWPIPNAPTSQARIRVTAHDAYGNLTSDASDANFTILSNSAPVLGSIGNQTVNEQTALTFTATATDGEAPPQTLTFSLDAGAPAGASINPSSGAFSWTPTEAEGPGDYPITIRVTDNGVPNLSDFELISVHVNEVNVAPVLAAIGNQSVNEGVALTFTASATDADLPANLLTYSLDVGAPAGASINPSSGAFSWTPTEAEGPGDYPITIRVTDNGVPNLSDFELISVHVNEVNVAPVLAAIGNQSVNEGVALTFTASATDADLPANLLTYSLDVGAPAGASINPSSGAFSWTPTEAEGPGDYPITIRVTDNGVPNLSDFELISVHVNEVNVAPVLAAIGNQSVNEGVALTFTASATDADLPANLLTYSLDAGAPAGASINPSSGAFSWTPTEAEGPGDYPITIRVTDNGVPNLSDFELISVHVNEVNVAPVLAAIGNQSVNEGVALTFTASATDADLPANLLTYSLDAGAPAGASINPSSGAFSWTPTEAEGPGDYPITIRVTDNGVPNLSDFELISVHVNEVNIAPTLSDVPSAVTIPELVAYSFTATAIDPDLPANTLTFSLVGAPAGASIGSSSGIFSWTPTETQGPGSYPFTVRVSDGTTNTDAAITITVDEVNVAPVLAAIGNQSVNEGVALTFTASATDADLPANALTYSLDAGFPAGASINPSSGAFSWTPTEVQGPGDYSITVRVTDNGVPNLSDFELISVHVSEANIAPTLSDVPSAVTIPELVAYSFTATASDPDLPANTLTFSLVGAPAGASIGSSSGIFSWTPTEAQGPGVYPFTVRLSDGIANTDAAITITVDDVTISAISDLAVTLVRTGNDADGTIKLKLDWTATPGGTTVEVYRARFGHYPEYAADGGAAPPAPTYPPSAPWELTSVTAPTQTDEVSNGPSGYAGRDYWTYVAFVHGSGANVSTGSNRPARPNYLIGDVSDGTLPGLGRGNNAVNIADISALGGSYGASGAAVAAVNYLDVGPTSDHSVTGLPLTDDLLNFEDLVLFAINFGNPPTPLATTAPRDAVAAATRDQLLIDAPTAVLAGEELAVSLKLSGTGQMQALSAALASDAKVVEPIGVDAGEWLTGQEGVAFSPKPGAVDVALLGVRSSGLAGEGVVATVRFRALAAGNPGIAFASLTGRDAENRDVKLDGAAAPAVQAVPAITQLSPAYPNPFAGSTTIDFSLAKAGPVSVSVYGVNGRLLRVLANDARAAGVYRLAWDGRDDNGRAMPAGLYFVQMSANGARYTNKISRLR